MSAKTSKARPSGQARTRARNQDAPMTITGVGMLDRVGTSDSRVKSASVSKKEMSQTGNTIARSRIIPADDESTVFESDAQRNDSIELRNDCEPDKSPSTNCQITTAGNDNDDVMIHKEQKKNKPGSTLLQDLQVDRFLWEFIKSTKSKELMSIGSMRTLSETGGLRSTLLKFDSGTEGRARRMEALTDLVSKHKTQTVHDTIQIIDSSLYPVIDRKAMEFRDNYVVREGNVIHIVVHHRDIDSVKERINDILKPKRDGSKSSSRSPYQTGTPQSLQDSKDTTDADLMEKCFDWQGRVTIHVFLADVTKLYTDALVCPAPPDLQLKVGIGRQVCACAGQQLQTACDTYLTTRGRNRLPTGDVFTTKGYQLLCNRVIHIISPTKVTHQDQARCNAALHEAFRKCLQEAEKTHAHSVIIPGIGLGKHGRLRPSVVAAALYKSVRDYFTDIDDSSIDDLLLVDLNADYLKHLQHEFVMGCDRKNLSIVTLEDGHSNAELFFLSPDDREEAQKARACDNK